MPTPTFAQPERRNFLAPAIIVAAVVAIAFALIHFFAQTRAADASIAHVAALPIHSSYATNPNSYTNGTHIVGKADPTEDDLYVLATVRVHDDDSKLPLFINDITGTLTTSDGDNITTSAIEKNDLASVYAAFPSLKSLSGPPLSRETRIAPGQTAEGMVMLQYQVPESVWKLRKSASITIEFYHQTPITIPIPQ